MSDTSEETSDRQIDNNNKEENVCRDYIRGVCDRKFCKYKHEIDVKMLNFCHDFQNTICPRPNCKFIHCTEEEEMEYKRTGTMSNHILVEATRKNQLLGTPPICHRFRKGLCRRNFCKYRHLTKEEEDAEIMELIQNNNKKNFSLNNIITSGNQLLYINTNNLNRRNGMPFDEYEESGMPLAKRRFLGTEPEILQNDVVVQHHNIEQNRVFKGYFTSNPPPPMLNHVDAKTLMLEEENSLLHKEIAQLKRQVSDLTATNEFLLDQNANLRVSNKRNENVNMPAVTITNTNTPQVIRTVTASVATVPVSLATVSTCNPVSVSIAGCPTVSMAPPAQILAPSQQILVTTNPQSQLAIAQQNLANNLAQQAAQPQLTSSQAQQLALATTTQQLALANSTQQQTLANQAQQLALANTTQQLTSQAQQLALANSTQLTSQAQQLAMANSQQHLAVTNVSQQLTLNNTNQQILAQQNLASNQQMEMHRNNQINAINTSQAIAMSNATQPLVSYPIMTQQSINHALSH